MGAWQVSKILPAAAAAAEAAASPKPGIAVFAENKRKTSNAVTSEGLASMRPSSQEAYASSGPRSPATHTHQHQQPTQRLVGWELGDPLRWVGS